MLIVYLIKIKVLTYTSHKEHYELYTENLDLIAVSRYQMQMPGLARKYIILFSDRAVTAYKARLRIWYQRKTKKLHSISRYLFCWWSSTKIKAAVLQERQGWEASQIKVLNLVIPENYRFMTSNNFLSRLVYLTTILKRLHVLSLLYSLTRKKHPLIHHTSELIITTLPTNQ